jgi:hypothetical protein
MFEALKKVLVHLFEAQLREPVENFQVLGCGYPD